MIIIKLKHLPPIANKWSSWAWDRPNMNKTHRKGRRLAKKIRRRALRRAVVIAD